MWRFWFQDRRSGKAHFSPPVYESRGHALHEADKKLAEIGLSRRVVEVHTEERRNVQPKYTLPRKVGHEE